MKSEIIKAIRDLGSLQRDISNLREDYVRIEDKIDNLIDRISKLESNYDHLRDNIKNVVLVELKEEIDRTKFNLELHNNRQLDEEQNN